MNSNKSTKARQQRPASRGKGKPENVVVTNQHGGTATALTVRSPPKLVRQPKFHPKHVEDVCALVDPFCTAALGAKYPDNSPTRTLPYSYHASATYASGADGALALLWHPSYAFQPITPSFTRVGSAVSVWSNFTAFTPIASVSRYRIVSSGFIVRNILAPLNSSGMLHLRSYALPDGGTYGAVDCLTYNVSSSKDIALQETKEIAAITQHSARLPQLTTNVVEDVAAINWADNGFTPLTIYVDGAPASTNCINIEIFINYELIFDDSAGLQQLATPPPPPNVPVVSATSIVTSEVKTVFHDTVRTAARFVASKAAMALSTYLGLGPAASLVAARVVD